MMHNWPKFSPPNTYEYGETIEGMPSDLHLPMFSSPFVSSVIPPPIFSCIWCLLAGHNGIYEFVEISFVSSEYCGAHVVLLLGK